VLILLVSPQQQQNAPHAIGSCDSENVFALFWERAPKLAPSNRRVKMSSHMPPIPPGNQSDKGPKSNADLAQDTSKGHKGPQNTAEQGDTANIKQNTTNAGFFKGRRVK
jgi:hypothetical protein